jgi:cell division protease FtsH
MNASSRKAAVKPAQASGKRAKTMSNAKGQRGPRKVRGKDLPGDAPRTEAADRLAALRTTGSPDFEFISEPDLKQMAERDQAATAAQEAAKAPAKEPMSARAAIVSAAIEAAASPAQRRAWSAPKRPIAVVVIVPTASWIRPVENYFDGSLKTNWLTFARDGSNKSLHKSDQGNDEVATALAKKRNVVGIAADISLLPAALVAAADITVSIASPNGAVLRKAMRRGLKGKLPPAIDDAITAGLDLDDLVAAFRPDSSPAEVIERLRAAAAARRGTVASMELPDLATAVEYGAARTWGLSLARDIADYRAGRISWSEIDRGAVLHSAPGFGKTLYAQILARACKIPLVVYSVGELFAKSPGHLDGVIKAQRRYFEQARVLANPCCLLFCDEIDAIPNRFTLDSHNIDWWLPVITDFMTSLDNAVGGREGIIVIGATNRIEAIDPAIMRPGRLERAIEIVLPDAAGVANIMRFHLKQDLLSADLTDIAELMEGSTPAELMEIVRGARRAARYANRGLTIGDLRARVIGSGNEDAAYLRRVSIHEATHAVASIVIPVGSLVRVQIRSQGNSGGHTRIEQANKDIETLADVEDRVTSILAAAVAERIILNSVSTGSGGGDSSDMAITSSMLAMLHTSTVITGNLFHRCSPEDALATVRADHRLRRIVEGHLRALELRAEVLVIKHRAAIVAVADELARTRHMTGDAVRAIVARYPPRAPAVKTSVRRKLH